MIIKELKSVSVVSRSTPYNMPRPRKNAESSSTEEKDKRRRLEVNFFADDSIDDDIDEIEYSVQTSNQFAALHNAPDHAEHQPGRNIPGPSKTKDGRETVSTKKVAPLIITNASRDRISAIVKSLGIDKYELKFMSIGIKLQLDKPDFFVSVKEALQKEQIKFFCYQLSADKLTKFVLSGLYNMPVDDLKKYLIEEKLFPVDIKPMNLKKARYTDHMNYIVFFKKGTTLKDLNQIRVINNVCIKWNIFIKNENINSPVKILQCSKCLLFGHMHRFCFRDESCALCSGNHSTEKCPKMDQDTDLKCCNCGGVHDARSLDCPKREEYLQIRDKMQSNRGSSRSFPRRDIAPPPAIRSTREFPLLQTPAQDHLRAFQRRLRDEADISTPHHEQNKRPSSDQVKKTHLSQSDHTVPVPPANIENQHIPVADHLTGYQRLNEGSNASSMLLQNQQKISYKNNQELFTVSQIINLTTKVIYELAKCSNKKEQFDTILKLSLEFLYNHDD